MEYWAKTSEEVVKALDSSEKGLDDNETYKRLEEYGLNDIPKRQEKSALSLFISQIKDPLIIALVAASFISYFTGGIKESIIIIAIVLVNSLVGFMQEFKSEKTLQKLCKYITYRAKVVRNGELTEVDTRKIVPGDVVVLETGDRVPADLRLIEAEELEADESLVTGEAFPVHKTVGVVMAKRPQEMKNVAFMGTLIIGGRGKGIAVATGMKSTFGETAGYLRAEKEKTNYEKNIQNFSKFLVKAITIGVVFILMTNIIMGKKIFDSALFSLALAVGIIPESLPIIIMIGLSRGAIKMSKKGVIIKKLSAIEELGDMDILCMDKTGTMTENKITLNDYSDLNGKRDEHLIKLAAACTSVVERKKQITGNPLDVAIIRYVREKKIPVGYKVTELIPFDYTRRRMSVVVDDGRKIFLVTKGGPESIISVCRYMKLPRGVTRIDADKAKNIYEELSKRGYRVIFVAIKEVKNRDGYVKSEECGMTLFGLLSFADPLKPTARQSVFSFKKLGIDIKILTGDNEIVARKIADDSGLHVDEVLTGTEVEKVGDEALRKIVERTTIFSRLTPEQKIRIVSAFRKNGHVVGFLGDGVNDAPVLRHCDVGISVESGVDIAKEASDIVLTKKSLRSIIDGIIEGRKTFGNTTKYIFNTVSANIGNMSTLAILSPFINFLPLLPSQILLTNMVSDGPLLAISTDRIDEEELKMPEKWNMDLISKFSVFFGGISSIFDFITILLLLFLSGTNIAMFRTGWFIESVMSEILVTFSIRTKKSFHQSRPSKILVLTSLLFGMLTLFLPFSMFSGFFEFVPLDPLLFLLVMVVLAMYFVVVEFAKHIFYRKFRF